MPVGKTVKLDDTPADSALPTLSQPVGSLIHTCYAGLLYLLFIYHRSILKSQYFCVENHLLWK